MKRLISLFLLLTLLLSVMPAFAATDAYHPYNVTLEFADGTSDETKAFETAMYALKLVNRDNPYTALWRSNFGFHLVRGGPGKSVEAVAKNPKIATKVRDVIAGYYLESANFETINDYQRLYRAGLKGYATEFVGRAKNSYDVLKTVWTDDENVVTIHIWAYIKENGDVQFYGDLFKVVFVTQKTAEPKPEADPCIPEYQVREFPSKRH